ncbi:hypothetical protein MMC11_003055 [Xylographa trunciseda]|nr:hypothetical protein [Xylographa trunciseda]
MVEAILPASDLTRRILASWHDYRLAIFLTVTILLVVAFAAQYSQAYLKACRPLSYFHLTSAPVEKSVSFSSSPDVKQEKGNEEYGLVDEKIEATQTQQSSAPKISPRLRLEPKRLTGTKTGKISRISRSAEAQISNQSFSVQPLVFFSSLTGNTESYAKQVIEDLKKTSANKKLPSILEPQLHDLSYIDYDDYFVSAPRSPESTENLKYFYLLILPTYNIDTILNNFLAHLQETHHDFRIDTAPMSGLLGYSVFGFGDREGWPSEEEGFCSQAKEVDKWMAKLTDKKRAFPLGMGDVKSDALYRLKEWTSGIEEILRTIVETGGLGEGVIGSGEAVESDEEDEEMQEVVPPLASKPAFTTKERKTKLSTPTNLGDLEDLGGSSPLPIDFTTTSTTSTAPTHQPLKPMVPADSPTYAALTKQGYTIIGTHSGVKICRWTKSALRGRGSCYKYSFYGIASHLCMETTPSLSCSNKCVFCWRHGTNPVGTTWRWQVDPPDLILAGAITAHLQKIKSLRGVPGVRAARFQEAQRIRHCALSLVGEPIFYPHINAFVALLHARRISSFLVCNAQHPDQLAALAPVTQLYVSIDASNRESLRAIDRPLHRDFWERFTRCLDILRARRFRMRTVFRLTLVKGFNIDDEVHGYAALVARGLPCFVEVKGVTYCGTSGSSAAGLTMQNVPFYPEVVAFVTALDRALAARGLEYGIAAEHAHSCCVLIASKRFLVQGKWRTLIDYEAFFACLERGGEFTPEEYMGGETPEWAAWGRGGFDPRDERVDRKGRKIVVEEGKAGQVVEVVEEGNGVEGGDGLDVDKDVNVRVEEVLASDRNGN